MSPRITDPADRAYLLALGQRVKIIRRVRGMSKVVPGERAGLDRGYLGRVEDGLHNPSAVTLLHLAHGSQCPCRCSSTTERPRCGSCDCSAT